MRESTQPSLLVIEAARIFDAETAALVGVFSRYGYQWKVLSNDPAWPVPAWPTAASIEKTTESFDPTVIHFALHGTEEGLVLRVSDEVGSPGVVGDVLAWADIERMVVWEDRVVITGACGMLSHASSFLRAGALAVVAPRTSIDWGNLCHFFRLFYTFLLDGRSIGDALLATRNYARGYYREYRSIDVEGDHEWGLKR
jgi:hypothetical protein